MVTKVKKRKIRQYRERLTIILEILQTMNQDQSIEDLLKEFEQILREELNVGKVLVFTYSGNEWKNILVSGVAEEEVLKIDVEKDLLRYTNIEELSISSPPPPSLKGFDSVIPLFYRYKAIGFVIIGDVEEEQNGIRPTIRHRQLIQIISNLIIVFVENKRMQKELLEQEALKKEMELASRIQNQLIPSEEQFPKNHRLTIKTLYHPHYGVGGDYYDIIQLSRNTIGFCIADVSGKGIAAAMLMSNFQAVVRTLFTARVNLKKLVHKLNARVNESANNEKFITMFIGRYNLRTRKLSYVNAGHLPPLYFDDKKGIIHSLDKGCIGLGMLDFIPTIEVGRISISKHSKLMAFTDGLIEHEQDDHVESNYSMIENIISNRKSVATNIEEIQRSIEGYIRSDAIFDDISLIGIEFHR
jgi:sigma-B regulation protein RsbU (phosphoserine phosphatase)